MTCSPNDADHGSPGGGHARHHDHGASPKHPAPPQGYEQFTADMHAGMATMMHDMHAAPPSGNADIDFLAMMIPHHVGAVDMARLVLRAGRDPLVREIAEKILAGQISEIEGMRGRLLALRRSEPEYPSLTGNRGA
ncbi:MAG: DUF305 domain-containing protein [Hyphomicrobium aestuarii]|nr:DUF305 domain-containing protein [Hyphomicrobium aestuarii]